ncbi:tRNA threonylcarbamoyladenosine biosynthesis protein TsaB [Catalinimonas alkaloidigena]|uniref:tRNA threonylcarbamoyladenosine biosynthesis protein TsaB n=1 Tax=Catalinimonas alkaloidigena TaxID=1075417 RepID=A0A1G9MIZ5_9BACT|nr:tRNA (adenosine(37)-N6)-threonylcarbamoyltransferase complex dimerization subunit type 1 TsaB [Catalinimonas alkaloidigena]SDL74256.1 tRNA threonylcarbamoyladenosine biosynthesis protein TsaB [Catalinimonas alkaloidigena]
MALILCLETSTTAGSVALHQDGTLLACTELVREKSHAESLNTMVDFVCRRAHRTLADIDAVAVSAGPGSYTGLRIGVSAAKGFCFAQDKPLLGIPTLAIMAHEVNRFNRSEALLCPMIDARRMEVYCALFNHRLEEVLATQPLVLQEDSFAAALDEHPIYFFGDGAAKSKPLLQDHPHAHFVEDVYPSARSMGVLAEEAFQREAWEDLAYFTPRYLKEFASHLKSKSKPKPA